MSGDHFTNQLALLCREKKSCIFLGLDPITQNIPHCFSSPKDSQVDLWKKYCHFALDALEPFIVGIKLQSAYFEMLGPNGITLMHDLAVSAKKKKLLVIFDGKRADIPDTSLAYAKTYLGNTAAEKKDHSYWQDSIDAMTVHPFFGMDTMVPFLKTAAAFGKMIFICLKTSNQGSSRLQNLIVKGDPFYLFLAKNLSNIAEKFSLPSSVYESLGFVVGANFPKEAELLRNIFPSSPFLVPGFGAQGSDEKLYQSFHFADDFADEKGKVDNLSEKKSVYRGAIYPLSRALLYPWLYSGRGDVDKKKNYFDVKSVDKREVNNFLVETAKNYASRFSL